MSRNGRVLVAMSGGVDSCVAAALLHECGYDVVGVFMRLGSAADAAHAATDRGAVALPVMSAERTRGCCSALDAGDARTVAARLAIPFYALNFQREFDRLIDDFADEYARGRTPNPCVRCNQWLKFGRLAEYANVVDAEFIATGHYARIEQSPEGPRLRRAAHRQKDQSYVLFGVARDVLARTLFPIGELSKQQVRDEARRLGLAVHDKPESQDICFVPDGNHAAVVERRRPGAMKGGEIRALDGRVVGRHGGVGAFTIGQRRGVRVAMGEPVYVTEIDAATATVTVGPRAALAADGLIARDVSWLRRPDSTTPSPSKGEGRREGNPPPAIRADVQIRYHHEPMAAEVCCSAHNAAEVHFDRPVEAVTPGQAAVFYDGDEVLGGGWIDRAV